MVCEGEGAGSGCGLVVWERKGAWRCPTFAREGPHYHRRWVVSRSSSGWNRVVPARYGRQAKTDAALVLERRRRHRYSSERGKTLGCYALKPHGRLVPVSCTHCCAFTSGLLTWWSSTALQEPVARVRGDGVWEGASRLDAFSGYPFRAWLPGAATGVTTGTPEARPLRSSRTGSGSPHVSKRLRQIGSELSHDVLNPTHVPL